MEFKEGEIKSLDQSFFTAIVENSTDLISVIDHTGIYKYVGKSVFRILGYTPEELMGTSGLDYIHTEDLPSVYAALQTATADTSVHVQPFRFRSKSGEWRWLECHISNMLHNENIQGLVTNSKDITKQKEAQWKEEKAQLYYKTLFADYPDALLTLDSEGKIVDANAHFNVLSEYTIAETIGCHYSQFIPEQYKQAAMHALQHVLKGKITTIETCLITKSGSPVELQVTGVPILLQGNLEGVQCVVKDISAKKKDEARLELLSLVASRTTNGVIITDKDRKIEWVNDSFTHLTGYSLKEVWGKNPGKILQGTQTNPETILAIREKLNKSESVSEEILNYRKDGEEIWFTMEINPILNNEGKVYKFIATQTDITSKKRSELELVKLTKDLFDHNRDLKQFTYIVSHNLRAPVANALGLVNLLTMVDKQSEVFKASLKNLHLTVVQLNIILKDLNLILSIRDNQDTVVKEQFSLEEVYQQAVGHLQGSLAACQGEVALQMDGQCTLTTKKAYLYSIFYNLLSNAIKYRSPDRLLKVKVSCHSCLGTGAVISIADNGLGMDLNKVGESIFKLYKRFHRNVEGRGMGLFLVKTHVEALGGRIEVRSQVNEGTEFVIYLP